MRLYNTLTRSVELFAPQAQTATIYVCGITPYDTTHLGHIFTYATFDVLIRYLEFNGYAVNYTQNVTDIDDDILKKAKEVDEDWQALGNRWTAHFIRDNQELNVRPPDHFPRATETIASMIEIIERLLAAGVAYESGGNVYFHIDDWHEYGKLSRLPRQEMLPIANERGNVSDDPHKLDPLDFVLWQAQADDEPAWESPWGAGRPGWHIECSTMATAYLGNTIDIHGGGSDLIFPHHDSEIAQAEAATGQKPFARFWMEIAMVRHEGEKMSKSLGNLVMVRDLLEGYSADALRLYLARHHYRQPWSHDIEELDQAELLALSLRQAVAAESGSGAVLDATTARARFTEAMDDDLDSPSALRALAQLADEIVDGAERQYNVQAAQQTLRNLSSIFGLRLDRAEPEERVVAGWDRHLDRFETAEEK